MYCKPNSNGTQIKIRTNEKILLTFSHILEFATFNLVSLAIFIGRKVKLKTLAVISWESVFNIYLSFPNFTFSPCICVLSRNNAYKLLIEHIVQDSVANKTSITYLSKSS